jgi:hypothetical protein
VTRSCERSNKPSSSKNKQRNKVFPGHLNDCNFFREATVLWGWVGCEKCYCKFPKDKENPIYAICKVV